LRLVTILVTIEQIQRSREAEMLMLSEGWKGGRVV
jgi:hypothetical protein